ncbi:MAG: pantoate--beta-alanine ligase [Fodinibius sp.]|nr:pantoate--beta-alanine ligase [Fodinibius sp.]
MYRSLRYVARQLNDGAKNVNLLVEHQKNELEAKGFEIDYLNVFSFERMIPVEELESSTKYILAGAVYLGETRLIDNMIIES